MLVWLQPRGNDCGLNHWQAGMPHSQLRAACWCIGASWFWVRYARDLLRRCTRVWSQIIHKQRWLCCLAFISFSSGLGCWQRGPCNCKLDNTCKMLTSFEFPILSIKGVVVRSFATSDKFVALNVSWVFERGLW